MGGVLDFGGMLAYRGKVRRNNDPKGLNRISVVAPDRWGPEQIDAVEPWFIAYTEAVPEVGTSVWIFEQPDGTLRYAFNEPGARTTSQAASLWPPMRAILIGMLDALDALKSHTHDAGLLVAGATAVTGTTGGPIETIDYGDARKDTEDGKPAAHTRLVTRMPKSEEDE